MSRLLSPEPVENDHILDNDGPGCGAAGNTAWVTQYGATTYEVERCPCCDGEVEYD